MNYLADTHILIWAITDSPKLSKKAREILLSENNNIYYSFSNVWEIAIKHSLHKSNITFSSQCFEEMCKLAGFSFLETKCNHASVNFSSTAFLNIIFTFSSAKNSLVKSCSISKSVCAFMVSDE